MQLNIVLGNLIDTSLCVKRLKNAGEEFIVVLDYDLEIDNFFENNVQYISPEYASKLVNEFHSVRYYKSLYIYPGMYKNIN